MSFCTLILFFSFPVFSISPYSLPSASSASSSFSSRIPKSCYSLTPSKWKKNRGKKKFKSKSVIRSFKKYILSFSSSNSNQDKTRDPEIFSFTVSLINIKKLFFESLSSSFWFWFSSRFFTNRFVFLLHSIVESESKPRFWGSNFKQFKF